MKMLEWEIKRLDALFDAVIDDLDPDLAIAVTKVLAEMNGRVTPYCGYRDEKAQKDAKSSGASNADWGESAHNFWPSMAIDVVINPAVISCRPHPKDVDFPDLWDDGMPRMINGNLDEGNKEAAQAWADLEVAAKKYGLERVDLKKGVRDRPHMQRRGWLTLVAGKAPGKPA